jgi:hypothetical protein
MIQGAAVNPSAGTGLPRFVPPKFREWINLVVEMKPAPAPHVLGKGRRFDNALRKVLTVSQGRPTEGRGELETDAGAEEASQERGFFVMSEWIKKLADNIKEKDHEELLKKEHQLHVAKVINEKGPAFWEEFKTKLQEYVDQMRADLGNQTLIGDLRFSQNGNALNIGKSEFPFVQFNAILNLTSQTISGSYVIVNPRPQSGRGGLPHTQLLVHFKLNHDNQLHAEIGNSQFHHGHELAEHVMKLLFTI